MLLVFKFYKIKAWNDNVFICCVLKKMYINDKNKHPIKDYVNLISNARYHRIVMWTRTCSRQLSDLQVYKLCIADIKLIFFYSIYF